tara:strand:- start:1901 stop:2998 length:1098 start_codon:yes stop_codon:yes gene_type:complete
MKFNASREALLKPLQAVMGVVERRQTMPILSNILLSVENGLLTITATDLEVELVTQAEINIETEGQITVSGRKLLDICKALPDQCVINISLKSEKLSVTGGKSKFNLTTLPSSEFPVIEDIKAKQTLSVDQSSLRKLIEKTHFSMAQQDVRYYLNGMLLETSSGCLKAVATDGHRLALCQIETDENQDEKQQVIVPRKGVLELQRLLVESGDVNIEFGANHIRIQLDNIRFTSKLIDGKFPEYERVIPSESSNKLVASKKEFKDALQRTAILSNEKYRGIRLTIKDSGVSLQAHNTEQEEAQEELGFKYNGEDIEIGFNVNYLLDALNAIEGEDVVLSVQNSNSSCLLSQPEHNDCTFVVMPMRL